MSRTDPRYRFPSGDKITTCEFCGQDTTGTGKTFCDACKAETSEEIRKYLGKQKAPKSYPQHG